MAERFIPQYVADEVLGEGGFGKVYRIHNQRAEDFALKVWKTRSPEADARLEAEVKVLARLSHPNLIRLFEYLPQAQEVKSVEEKGPGIVMEFVPGESLGAWLQSREISDLLDLFVQALRALGYLHARHLTHGDLKPANLKVTKKGILKILDFGLAGRLDEGGSEVAGTLEYLAPEALRGERVARSDLFSLGVIFYEVLTGKKPYDPLVEISRRFLIPPPAAHEMQKKIPPYLSEILGRLLEADVSRRFSSAPAVIRALNRHLDKPYELSDAAREVAAEEIPFLGHEEFLMRGEAIFREWTAGARRSPLLLLHGATGTGKSRLAKELAWQARLRGIDFHASTVEEFLKKEGDDLSQEEMTLVILEDIHRATPRQLVELAKGLADWKVRFPRLGFLLSWDPNLMEAETSDRIRSLIPALGAEVFEVKNLSPDEIRAMIQETLDEIHVPNEWVESLDELTGGNPALLLACLQYRRAQGGGVPKSSRRDWEEVTLPEGFRRSLNLKWDRLSHEERQDTMRAVLLREAGESPLHAARPLFRKFFLARLGAKETQALQKQLFAELHTRMDSDPLLLAELAKGAGESEAFRTHGVQAADLLLRNGEVEWAIDLYRQVLQSKPPPEQEAYVWAYLASAFSRLSRFEEALEAYEKWFALTEDDGTGIQTLKYHYLVGTLLSNWGKAKKALEHFRKALKSGDSSRHESHVPFHLKTFSSLGRLSEQEGDIQAAREYYELGLALGKADSPEKAQLLRNLGVYWLHQKDRGRGRYYLESAVKISRELGYDEGLINAAFLLANLAKREGRQDEALVIYGQVLEMAEKKQDPLKKGRTHSNMAAVLIEMGDYGHAEEQAVKAEPLLARGTELDRFLNRYHLATIGAYLGQFTRAEDPDLLTMSRRLGRGEIAAFLDRLKGEALRLQRDFQGALQAFARARSGFKKLKDEEEINTTVLMEVFCECLAGDLAAARERFALWQSLPEKDAHALVDFHRLAAEVLSWEKSPGIARIQDILQPVLRSAQQEWVILALRAVSEILLRLEDQEAADSLRQKAFEWLDGLYRSLPEEMQLSFEHREDFERLAETHRRKLKSTGISRERFLTFTRINHRLSETSDMRAILEQVMDAAMALAGADRGFLLTNEKKKSSQVIPGFRVETARNLKKENVSGEEFKISLSVIQESLRRRVTILTDNAQADPQFKHAESVHLYGLKSILVLPLLGEKECLGVIYLDHRFEVGAFSDEILMFLKAFADQSVLAIEKARVLGELSRANRSLSNRVEEQAYQIENLETQLQEARKNLRFGYEEIIAHSPKMIQILQLLDRITDTRVPVWIHGESGTGKELIARALHYNSDRKAKPFIAENCSAIPENLLESVLFGHVKGAFTHAEKDKMGLFEAANGGTIFLDEIGDMPMPMQAKLLRVLQEGEIKRVGSNQAVKVDVRVLSATNKNLPELVKQGKFREDLFFRLNGMRINLPPLRERKEDIPLLSQHFIEKVAKESNLKPCPISEGALKILANYDWPGNIRELENAIRNAVIFGDGKTIGSELLGFKPELFGPPRPKAAEEVPSVPRVLEGVEREREAILDALVRAHYHKGQAAKELKVTPRHLYNLLEKYQLPKNKWALKKLVEEERR